MKRLTKIQRYWGDLPVVDAKDRLRIMPCAEDIEGATRRDPSMCAMAMACRRMFHSKNVLFLRTVAYVEVPSPVPGKRIVERFFLNKHAREQIAEFDKSGKFDPAGYILHAPHKAGKLDSKRKNNIKYRARVLAGKAGTRHNPKMITGVRDGTGHVRMMIAG